MRRLSALTLTLTVLLPGALVAERIEVRRVPGGGIQPRVVTGQPGIVHLVYYTGKAGGGDLHHVLSRDGGETFSKPVRVNSIEKSAVAAGTIRGAQIAPGRDGSLHVAWNGAGPSGPHGAPMYYTRLAGKERAFEPQRNLSTRTRHLDGGGSVAADDRGHVFVVWHASARDGAGEEAHRAVWVAKSADDGKTFAPEEAIRQKPTGACSCCGLKAFATREGSLFALYRTARQVLNRDMRLLMSRDVAKTFEGRDIDPWRVPKCVMSQSDIIDGPGGPYAAWETRERVFFGAIDRSSGEMRKRIEAVGLGENRKHPALAVNAAGEVLVTWTEGTGWNRGGALAWQLFDRDGEPVDGATGRRDGIPVWSFPAAFAIPDGEFVILH